MWVDPTLLCLEKALSPSIEELLAKGDVVGDNSVEHAAVEKFHLCLQVKDYDPDGGSSRFLYFYANRVWYFVRHDGAVFPKYMYGRGAHGEPTLSGTASQAPVADDVAGAIAAAARAAAAAADATRAAAVAGAGAGAGAAAGAPATRGCHVEGCDGSKHHYDPTKHYCSFCRVTGANHGALTCWKRCYECEKQDKVQNADTCSEHNPKAREAARARQARR